VRDVNGVQWGMLTLMGGVTKPQHHTGQFHYIFFVVWGRAYLTLGDRYTVPYEEVPMAQGFVTEVQRGNCYSIRNAYPTAPVTFMFCNTLGPMPAAGARKIDVGNRAVG
jgi:mannose-6-phosphate isomerase-like protein (cupin superfamily)